MNMKRASLLAAVVAVLGVGAYLLFSDGSQRKPDDFVVMSYGGSFADAQREAYYKPFEAETGVRVGEAPYNGEYGKLKAAIASGSVPDVADIEASALMRGSKENLFLEIDYNVVPKADLIPQAVHRYAVGTDIYSVSLGWNPSKLTPGTPAPQTWADLWDTVRYPGPRTLKKDPRFTLEIALMADGVKPADLYVGGELDVERAFRKLDQLKPHVKVWWTTGQQPIDLIEKGDVTLGAAFGARLWLAQKKEGRNVAMTWNQGILDIEYWSVLRGARNPERSMQFIAFASRPDRQAAFSALFPLGPVNRKAFEHLDTTVAKELNTYAENLSMQVFLNAEWWSEHEERLVERFNQWLQQ